MTGLTGAAHQGKRVTEPFFLAKNDPLGVWVWGGRGLVMIMWFVDWTPCVQAL